MRQAFLGRANLVLGVWSAGGFLIGVRNDLRHRQAKWLGERADIAHHVRGRRIWIGV